MERLSRTVESAVSSECRDAINGRGEDYREAWTERICSYGLTQITIHARSLSVVEAGVAYSHFAGP